MAKKPTTKTNTTAQPEPSRLSTLLLFLLPIVLLAGVIALFLTTNGGLNLEAPVPVEDLKIERYVLERNKIDIYVRNAGPDELTIAQVVINEAIWPFTVTPDATIPRLGTAVVHLEYPWSTGEAYGVNMFTSNAVAFGVDIPVAFDTPTPDKNTLISFTLIGLYVGVIPVFLGIFWFPALRRLGRRWMIFLMAVTAGLLVFLGLD